MEPERKKHSGNLSENPNIYIVDRLVPPDYIMRHKEKE